VTSPAAGSAVSVVPVVAPIVDAEPRPAALVPATSAGPVAAPLQLAAPAQPARMPAAQINSTPSALPARLPNAGGMDGGLAVRGLLPLAGLALALAGLALRRRGGADSDDEPAERETSEFPELQTPGWVAPQASRATRKRTILSADDLAGQSADELSDGLDRLAESPGRKPATDVREARERTVLLTRSRVGEVLPHAFGSLVGLTHITPVGCWCRVHDLGEWRMHDAELEIGGSFRAPA
jgi:hypothetical protein